MKTSSACRPRAAFSLIELIVVIAIIAVIATFTVPAATSILRGSSMTQAQQMLTDQISLARQYALSKNRSVEVRFYQFADPEQPGETATNASTGQFRGLQVFEVVESGVAVPIDKVQRLPATVIMNQTDKLSTLLGDTAQKPWKDPTNKDPELPRGVGKNYKYAALRFQPDGSTTLGATANWFLTIHNLSDGPTVTTPPANFFTIQIDPVSGSTKGFRPTAG